MSFCKGICFYGLRIGQRFYVGFQYNLSLRAVFSRFHFLRGEKTFLYVGPVLLEW